MTVTEWAICVETRQPDGTRERCEIGSIRRDLSAPVPDNLGLRLAEAKDLLQQLQLRMIEGQIEQSTALDRRCCHCGLTRPLHDYRQRVIQILFGTLPVRQPRIRRCPCRRAKDTVNLRLKRQATEGTAVRPSSVSLRGQLLLSICTS
jgi:hypothetical protein